jgi:thioredoxin 1
MDNNNLIYDLSEQEFHTKINETNKMILLDFWGEGCGPCKQMEPIIYQIAEENSKNIIVFKINIKKNINIMQEYKIRSIPTFMLILKNKIIATHIGLISKLELQNFINRHSISIS